MLFLMNTSILTNLGTFEYVEIRQEKVVELMINNDWTSAIGHESTAEVMRTLTGLSVGMNRISVKMETGDQAIVFKLDSRPAEGAILDRSELERIGFSWGMITRIK